MEKRVIISVNNSNGSRGRNTACAMIRSRIKCDALCCVVVIKRCGYIYQHMSAAMQTNSQQTHGFVLLYNDIMYLDLHIIKGLWVI